MLIFFVYASQREIYLSLLHRRNFKLSLRFLPILYVYFPMNLRSTFKVKISLFFCFSFDFSIQSCILVSHPFPHSTSRTGRVGGYFVFEINSWKAVDISWQTKPFFFAHFCPRSQRTIVFPVLKRSKRTKL